MPRMTAREVADRLGVRLETVYAYASRGTLTAHRTPGSRRSSFDREEVEALARRGRPRRGSRPSALDLVVETAVTTISGQRVRYRGRDACAMARERSFEAVAHLLWTGGDDSPAALWEPYPIALPSELRPARDRIRVAVVMASAAEPLRADLRAPAVVAHARRLIASMADAVPARSGQQADQAASPVPGSGRAPVRGSIAARLWDRLAGDGAPPGLAAATDAALVLLADHELASSTVTARVAASVRADPFSVVLAGLGTIAGPLHAGASALAHRLVEDALAHDPGRALATAREARGTLPGFGHPLYPDGDPRAALLLEMITSAAPTSPTVTAARAVADAARRRSGVRPSIDFAMGVFSAVARMPPSAGETIFTIARTAGWIAHAVEEYAERPVRFRARAIPRPESGRGGRKSTLIQAGGGPTLEG